MILRRRQKKRETKQWVVCLRRWRKHLDLRDTGAAIEAIRSVRHPAAVPAIIQLYASDVCLGNGPVCQTVAAGNSGHMDAGSAAAVLIQISLDEDNKEFRLACLDHVLRRKPPTALAAYVVALSDSDNARVNRTAQTLAQLRDSSAVGPLIDALVTGHDILVPDPSGRSSASTTPTFSSGGPGLSVGNRDRVFLETVANNEVLAAFVPLSDGANYYFYQDAWRSWYEAQRQAVTFNARR